MIASPVGVGDRRSRPYDCAFPFFRSPEDIGGPSLRSPHSRPTSIADGFVIIRDFATPDEVQEIRTRAEAGDPGNRPRGHVQQHHQGPGAPRRLFRGTPPQTVGTYPSSRPFSAGNPKRPRPVSSPRPTRTRRCTRIADAVEGAVIWIALDETGKHNGCLHFLKGSHRRRGGVCPPAGPHADRPVRSSRHLRSGDAPPVTS